MEIICKSSFSIQAQLIREMQSEYGREPCYATPVSAKCDQRTREKCSWRHDCFDEAGEQPRNSEE
jgi:hypothetical protein